ACPRARVEATGTVAGGDTGRRLRAAVRAGDDVRVPVAVDVVRHDAQRGGAAAAGEVEPGVAGRTGAAHERVRREVDREAPARAEGDDVGRAVAVEVGDVE